MSINITNIKNFLKGIYPLFGGVLFFFILFMYGLMNSLSISYMGNTSKRIEEIIFNNFLGDIIYFVSKIFIIYLLIAIIIGTLVHIGFKSLSFLLGKKISNKKSFILNFLISSIIYLQFFLRDIINYPQMYMNNFYMKNSFNKFIVEFATDNFRPQIFNIILIIFMAIIVVLYIIFIIKYKNKYKKKLLYAALACFIVVISVLLFIKRNNPVAQEESSKPNVLILACDALRPDHFSGNGYFRETTPNIDKLMAEGTSFDNTYIEVPRTFPSWISILTGQFASTHGIRHMFPTSRDVNRDFKSVTKILKQNGYTTSVFADFAGDIFTRIYLGFDKVDTPYFNMRVMIQQIILDSHTFLLPFLTGKTGLSIFPALKDAVSFCPPDLVKQRVIREINQAKKSFFMVTFFSSTHFPYSTPYPYYKVFADKNYKGPYKYFKQRIVSLDSSRKTKISKEDIKQVRALYDGGLKAFDDSVGEIITVLKNKGIFDNTIIIVLSDHGENLYEDSLGMGHGEHFRGSYALRIPFILRYPKIAKGRKIISELVRHVDIAPTILSLLKIPVPDSMEGVSLLPLIKNEKIEKLDAFGETGIWFDNSPGENLFFQKQRIIYPDISAIAEIDMNFDFQIVLNDDYRDLINLAKHRYVYDGRYKLIYMPLKDKVLYEMYDTKIDPKEKKNIARTDKKNFLRLKNELFKWIKRNNDVIIRKDFIYPILRY